MRWIKKVLRRKHILFVSLHLFTWTLALNGMGIKPKQPLKEMKTPDDDGTPVELPEFSAGVLPNLS